MLEVTTESGAVYRVDPENERFKRLSGPEVINRKWDDDVWETFTYFSEVLVGHRMIFGNDEGQRTTTPVVSFLDIST